MLHVQYMIHRARSIPLVVHLPARALKTPRIPCGLVARFSSIPEEVPSCTVSAPSWHICGAPECGRCAYTTPVGPLFGSEATVYSCSYIYRANHLRADVYGRFHHLSTHPRSTCTASLDTRSIAGFIPQHSEPLMIHEVYRRNFYRGTRPRYVCRIRFPMAL